MTGAGTALQAAAVAALQAAEGLGGVYDGPPLQAAFPYAVVACGPVSDWSHKSGTGREARLAVTIRDKGERPARLQALMAEAEAALGVIGPDAGGWRVITLHFLRSRIVRERVAAGPGGSQAWAGVLEYRARMLAD